MQKNAKKKNALKPVYKPYLRGVPFGKAAARRCWRILGYTALFAFLYVMVGTALSGDNTFLRVLMNSAMIAACAAMLYNEGARQGEGDVAFAEIAQNRLNEGKKVPESEKVICYHPAKGFITALIGIAPVFLLALVFACVAQKQRYTLGVLPSWVAAYEGQAEIGQALAYYQQKAGVGFEDVLRVIVRVIIFPFVNMAGVDNYNALYVIDKLSPLFCLVTPLFYGVGYLRGPHLRALVHGNIRLNRRRHNKNERKAREKRAQQSRENKKELI